MKFEYERVAATAIIEKQPKILIRQKLSEGAEDADRFRIIATPEGITIDGRMRGKLESKEDLNSFAEAVSVAFTDFMGLQKALRARIMRKVK